MILVFEFAVRRGRKGNMVIPPDLPLRRTVNKCMDLADKYIQSNILHSRDRSLRGSYGTLWGVRRGKVGDPRFRGDSWRNGGGGVDGDAGGQGAGGEDRRTLTEGGT